MRVALSDRKRAQLDSEVSLCIEWRRLQNKWRAMGIKSGMLRREIPDELHHIMCSDLKEYNLLVDKWCWYIHGLGK